MKLVITSLLLIASFSSFAQELGQKPESDSTCEACEARKKANMNQSGGIKQPASIRQNSKNPAAGAVKK